MGIQVLLVLIALACVPCMLIVKTMVLRRQHLWKKHLVCESDPSYNLTATFWWITFITFGITFFFSLLFCHSFQCTWYCVMWLVVLPWKMLKACLGNAHILVGNLSEIQIEGTLTADNQPFVSILILPEYLTSSYPKRYIYNKYESPGIPDVAVWSSHCSHWLS